jgi:hypothetical protein
MPRCRRRGVKFAPSYPSGGDTEVEIAAMSSDLDDRAARAITRYTPSTNRRITS